jgi:hypothetical protein
MLFLKMLQGGFEQVCANYRQLAASKPFGIFRLRAGSAVIWGEKR